MSHVIFCSISEPNHFLPLIPFAREFHNRGHQVEFYRDTLSSRIKVDLKNRQEIDYPEMPSPYHDKFSSFYQQLLDAAASGIPEYKSLFQDAEPDLVVIGSLNYAAAIAAEAVNIPWVVLGTNPGFLEPKGSVPYTGRGMKSLGIFTRLFRYLHEKSLKKYNEQVNELRESEDLQLIDDAFLQQMLQTPIYIALTLKQLEPGEPKFPARVDFIGPVAFQTLHENQAEWLDNMLPPVLYVPLNNIPEDDNHIFVRRLAEGLGDKSCSVVIESRSQSWDIALPENFRQVKSFNSQIAERKVHLMIHRGNYLANASAIHSGLPSIIVTAGAESREIASRSEHAGIALSMDMNSLRSNQIGRLMTQILQEPMYRMMAERLKDRLRHFDPVKDVTSKIEERL